MKLDDIMNAWEQDSSMDETELGTESVKTPYLHHKYFKMYTQEGIVLKNLQYEQKMLYKLKYQYYMGILDEETMKEKGWEPNPLKILKQDMAMYLESDPDLQMFSKRMDIQEQKLTFLESVIKVIMNRTFVIKNAIEWNRFKAGG
jgi:hypothetical protein